MQIFFGAPAPFAYPTAPALAAAAPNQPSAADARPAGAQLPAGSSYGAGSFYSLFGNPVQGMAQPAAPAQNGGHTVVNSTNALKSSGFAGPAAQGAMPAAGFGGGFTGGYLVPAFAAPIMVPGFFVMAMPYAVAAPMAAPVSAPVATQPAAPEEVVEAPPQPEAPAAPAAAPVVDVVPAAATEDVALSQPLMRLFDGRSEVSFSLTLTTLEGDTVSIDFRQETAAAGGVVIDGDSREYLQRDPEQGGSDSFTLNIDGDLNLAERQAIDALMDEVLTLADAFFRGNDSAVTRGLLNLNLDGQALSEMALSLSVTQSVEVQRGYGRDMAALDQLRRSGDERLATLEFLASEQKQLIEQAREIFDAPSAVRFVRDTLGPLLQGSLDSLNDALADTFAAPEPENDVDSEV